MPKKSKSLHKSGKLDTKTMPKSEFYALYQNYVCSTVLRIAREAFAALPIQDIIITAKCNVLNKSTGHLEYQAILSAYIPRRTLEILNMYALYPADSMKNFICNMDFKRTIGFTPVEEVRRGQWFGGQIINSL
jgi:hypothetical protein